MPDGGLKKKKSTKTAKTKVFQLLLLSHRNYKYWLLITQLWPYLTFLKKNQAFCRAHPACPPVLQQADDAVISERTRVPPQMCR